MQLEILEIIGEHHETSPLEKLLFEQLEKLKEQERFVRLIQNGLDVISAEKIAAI